MSKLVAACLCIAVSTAAVAAQGIGNLTISGNQVTATLDLQGISADLTLTFEQAVGLTAGNLGLSAQLVNPQDPNLLSRLPAGGLVTLPGAFPVLVRVQPPAGGGLSFSGVYTLDLHTHNLELTANCPLRLFSAPDGGPFDDITGNMGTGSYRVRGSKGSFSDFLIVADARPTSGVVNQKFDALSGLLSTYAGAIPGPVLDDLTRQLQAARGYFQAGDRVDAATAVNGFAATVQRNSGAGIPDVWRASGDLPNVAGRLRAAAGTLSFSLSLAPATP
ncbi:MAG: hypothetical protein JOZ15_03690 [Acidobacteria bacterium]|nr:hypothetical protein [Acidobacteriota bacterium]